MFKSVSAIYEIVLKTLAAAGPFSSISVSAFTRQHDYLRIQQFAPLGLKLLSTKETYNGEVAISLRLGSRSDTEGQGAAMVKTHAPQAQVLLLGLVRHISSSAYYNASQSFDTCAPAELSRQIAALLPSSSTPVALLCSVLQQRSSDLTADELSSALCKLLHLGQLCIQPHPQAQSHHNSRDTAFSACSNLALQLLHPQPHPDLSTAALLQLLTACFDAQHMLPALDLHYVMESLWVKLLENSSGSTLLQQLPADKFVQLLAVSSQLQTPSGIPLARSLSSTPDKEKQDSVELDINITSLQHHRALGLERSRRWLRIMNITQQRVSTGDFEIAQLGELASNLRMQTQHGQVHNSIGNEPFDNHHSATLSAVIHCIKQQLPSAPLEEAAAAARSLGQAHLLGEAQLLYAFSTVINTSGVEKLSPAGLNLWLEAICRALIDTRHSCNSTSEELASKMLSIANVFWLQQAQSECSSTQQLTPLFWALSKVGLLVQSDLRTLLSRCDDTEWVSVGPVEAVQLVYACLKGNLWKNYAATGLLDRVTLLLPNMNVHTLAKLIKMLQENGHACSLFSEQIWQALQTSLPQSSNQDLLTMYTAADAYQRPVLRCLITRHAIQRLDTSLDADSQQPLIVLICAAAAVDLISQPDKIELYQRVKLLLGGLQDQQVALLAFHLPLLGQLDQTLADQISAYTVQLLPSFSLTDLARILSGVARLGRRHNSANYSRVMQHVVLGVSQGCSQQELNHVCAWMLEADALFVPELAVAVASAVTKLVPADIPPNLAAQLAQLISQQVIIADVTPLLLQALQHRESAYTAHQLTMLLSMLCDLNFTVSERLHDRLLTLIKSSVNSKHSLRPVGLQLYNIFSKRQHKVSSELHNGSARGTALPLKPSMPQWLRDMLRDPTVVLMECEASQLCNEAQQWAKKFPDLNSLLYANLQLISERHSQCAGVEDMMSKLGCNKHDHTDLALLIAAPSSAS